MKTNYGLIWMALVAALMVVTSNLTLQAQISTMGGLPIDSSEVIERFDMNYGNYLVAIMRQKHVQEELEILDYQVKAVEKSVADAQRKLSESFIANRGLIETEGQAAFQKANVQSIKDSQKSIDTAITETTLLPFQVSKLKQILRWHVIESAGDYTAFFKLSNVVDKLEIDEDQAKEMDQLVEKLQEEYAKDLRKLRDKYRNRFNAEALTKKQRLEVKSLLGDALRNGSQERANF